ncbi:hypothetical protein Hypma_011913 [Hypsizygus marmoreus]|uniref:F-box domain-containing protein n=1 Tax=Hypsizygus marmoreus TaxID=39966 RepID=A0A369JKX5_HYPMA|nr:hypothetical protein Hypma_011913 [Hypsizygus marmoreus]
MELVMLGPRIPPELIDLVFDHCTSNRGSLCAFSLVCKTYFMRSRRPLFSKLLLKSNEDAENFIDLLRSPLCTLTEPDVVYELTFDDQISEDPSWYSSKLSTLNILLPALKALELNLYESPSDSQRIFEMQPMFADLRELQLDDVMPKEDGDLMHFVASFPLLIYLGIDASWVSPEPPPNPFYCLSPHLSSLILLGCTSNIDAEQPDDADLAPSINSLEWAELDTLLAESKFTDSPLEVTFRLDATVFHSNDTRPEESFEADIMRRMPLSSKKHMLVVVPILNYARLK